MSDMLATFFVTLAFYGAWQVYRYNSHWAVFTFFVAGAASIMTRYGTAIPIATIGVWLFMRLLKARFWAWKGILFGVLAAVVITLPHFLLRGTDALGFLHKGPTQEWSLLHLFERKLAFDSGVFEYLVPNVMYILSPFAHAGYLLLGLPLIAYGLWQQNFGIFRSKYVWLVLPYLVFLGGIPFQNQRFFVIVFPLVSLAFFPLFRQAFQQVRIFRPALWAVVLMQIGIFGYSFNKFFQRVLFEKEVATLLKQNREYTGIYTFDIDISFAYHQVPQQVHSIFLDLYDDFEPGQLVLVRPDVVTSQWDGQNPERNWHRLKKLDLVLLRDFNNGWRLYVIR